MYGRIRNAEGFRNEIILSPFIQTGGYSGSHHPIVGEEPVGEEPKHPIGGQPQEAQT